MNKSKSPYAARVRKQSPRQVLKLPRYPALLSETLALAPPRTRASHRATHSLGTREAVKVLPGKLFIDRFETERTAVKQIEPKSMRMRQASPKTPNQAGNRGFTRARDTPKAKIHHRKALSLLEDLTNTVQFDNPRDQSGAGNASVVGKWNFATRQGYIPGNPGKVNQDAYICVEKLLTDTAMSLFAVCDGHGLYGHEVSGYLKNRLPKAIIQEPCCKQHPGRSLAQSIMRLNQEVMMGAVDCNMSGSTCIAVLLQNDQLWCANVGDSRAVLGRKTGGEWSAVPLSRDHKPDLRDESERILKAGGRVAAYQDEEGNPLGPARVWLRHVDTPGLAMSRSIGDAVAASVGVIGTPEVLHTTLKSEDKFLVVGSDGVFEFISNEEVVAIIAPFWGHRDAESACKAVEAAAYAKWAEVKVTQDEDVVDDITCVVVFLEVL